VEDASGARFHLHEYLGRRFLVLQRLYQLDTGEPVKRVDSSTLRVDGTGEPLVLVA
jgi:hypothetical protein